MDTKRVRELLAALSQLVALSSDRDVNRAIGIIGQLGAAGLSAEVCEHLTSGVSNECSATVRGWLPAAWREVAAAEREEEQNG